MGEGGEAGVNRTIPMPLGPCRLCGRAAYLADDEGPAHPCCVLWAEAAPGVDCPACRQGEAQAAAQEKREMRRPRRAA